MRPSLPAQPAPTPGLPHVASKKRNKNPCCTLCCVSLCRDPSRWNTEYSSVRQGEAISWHVVEELRGRNRVPKGLPMERVAFTEAGATHMKPPLAHLLQFSAPSARLSSQRFEHRMLFCRYVAAGDAESRESCPGAAAKGTGHLVSLSISPSPPLHAARSSLSPADTASEISPPTTHDWAVLIQSSANHRNPPPQIDSALIDAYLARRALDYLVGFHISPVLWRKLPGARSAGRVQSVALRLVCEREAAVEVFRPVPYWTVSADLSADKSADGSADTLSAALTHVNGRRLGKLDLATAEQAEEAARLCRELPLRVKEVTRRPQLRAPPPPFTTSTMQQAASTQLGMGASSTMSLAQRLYEARTRRPLDKDTAYPTEMGSRPRAP